MIGTLDGSHDPRASWFDRAALVLFAGVLALVLAVFGDYGVTADEHVQDVYGGLVLDYYASFGADQTANSYYDLFYYGALFDVMARLLQPWLPLGPYEVRHLLCGLIGLGGIVGTWRLARLLGGPGAGLVAVVILALTPYWLGQMFNNTKDIPFATFYVWSLYYIARMMPMLPAPTWQLSLRLGLCLGLALAIRIGGVLLIAQAAILFALVLALRGWTKGDGPWLVYAAPRSFATAFLPAVLVGYAIMLAFWPWAQQAPVANPLHALVHFADIPVDYPVLYLGREIAASEVPRDYAAVSIAVRLPEPVLALVALGLMSSVTVILRALRQRMEVATSEALLLVAVGLPIAYTTLRGATFYDGFRHLTFVLPPLAVMAALAATRPWSWSDRLPGAMRKGWRILAGGLAAGWLALHIATLVQLHPYQYVYFNALAGGIAGAVGKFDLDYWSSSFREAVLRLDAQLRSEQAADGGQPPVRVAVCGAGYAAAYYFPPNVKYVEEGAPADFVVALNRGDCLSRFRGRRYLSVERQGAILSGVIDLRPGAPGPASVATHARR